MKIAFVNQASQLITFHHGISALSAYIKANSHHEVHLIHFYGTINPLDFQHQIEELSPDVIAFSAMSVFWNHIKELSRLAKEASSAITICGGYHPTLLPEEAIAHPYIDLICRGEGEEPLLEFLDALEKGKDYTHIQNLWVKQEGGAKIFRNEVRPLIRNLDDLPFWDRDLFDYDKWFGKTSSTHYDTCKPERAIPIYSGRGCYFNCYFCGNEPLQRLYHKKGKFVRTRSVDDMIEEMKLLKKRFNPDVFEVMEELFATGEKWLQEFAEKYPKEVGVPFRIWYRFNFATEKNIKLLAKAGCKSISFGVECGNEEYRKKYLNRKMSNEQIIEGCKRVREAGIQILSFNMMAMPFETYENVQETIELNRKIRPDVLHWFVFQPYPGTRLREICKENHLITSEDMTAFSKADTHIKLTHMTEEEFQQCVEDLLELQTELQGYNWRDLWDGHSYYPIFIQKYQKGDEYKLMDLYNQLSVEDRKMEYWRWKYEANPYGFDTFVAKNPKDEIVGNYSEIGIKFNLCGEEQICSQFTDMLIAHELRQNRNKEKIFRQLEEKSKNLHKKYVFSYIFTDNNSEKKFTQGICKGFSYGSPREIFKLVKNLGTHKISFKDKIKHRLDKFNYEIKPIFKFDGKTDQLWEKCKKELSFSTVRNSEYLNWRYIEKPEITYLSVGIYHKNSGELKGLAILQLNAPDKNTTTLLEWLVPKNQRQAAKILLYHMEHSALLGGTKKLEACFAPNSDKFNFFLENGYVQEKTDFLLLTRNSEEIDVSKWHYTFGDFYK